MPKAKAPRVSKQKPIVTPFRRFFFKLELLPKVSDTIHRIDAFTGGLPASHSTSQSTIHTSTESNITSPDLRASAAANLTSSSQPPIIASCPDTYPQRPACVALQQNDVSLDAIVITTLTTFPFCCHEDLISMPRPKLVEVAQSLNAKLPASLQIELDEGRSDDYIRKCIEKLVGIQQRVVPGAPKPLKSAALVGPGDIRGVNDGTLDRRLELASSPTPMNSPLAMRARGHKRSAEIHEVPNLGSPRRTKALGMLQEEDEPAEKENIFIQEDQQRSAKRRKRREMYVCESSVLKDQDGVRSAKCDNRVEVGTIISTGETREQCPSLSKSTMVLRSHSKGSQSRRDSIISNSSCSSTQGALKIDKAFINTKPRYRSTSQRSAASKKGSGPYDSVGSVSSRFSLSSVEDEATMGRTSTPKRKGSNAKGKSRPRGSSGISGQVVGRMQQMNVNGNEDVGDGMDISA